MINNVPHAIVKKGDHLGLIDIEGNVYPTMGFEFKSLYHNYYSKGTTQWFFYEKDNGERGFMSDAGQFKLKGELLSGFYGSDIENNGLIGQRNDKVMGVVNLETMEWEVRPQEQILVDVGYQTKVPCVQYSYQIEREDVVETYYMINENGNLFYMDRNGTIFKPR